MQARNQADMYRSDAALLESEVQELAATNGSLKSCISDFRVEREASMVANKSLVDELQSARVMLMVVTLGLIVSI